MRWDDITVTYKEIKREGNTHVAFAYNQPRPLAFIPLLSQLLRAVAPAGVVQHTQAEGN